jgi:ribosomal protein S9
LPASTVSIGDTGAGLSALTMSGGGSTGNTGAVAVAVAVAVASGDKSSDAAANAIIRWRMLISRV